MDIRPGPATGPLLLADISGYTSFLSTVTEAHKDDSFANGNIPDAYALVSSLLDGIIESVSPPYTLAKLEGDAVFAFSPSSDGMPRGTQVLDCLHGCYAAFKGRLAGARDVWSCRCDACARVDSLDLKFVLHAGPFIIQSMRGGTELVGGRPYALISEAAAAMFDVPWDGSLPLLEQYEHLPPVGVRVIVLA